MIKGKVTTQGQIKQDTKVKPNKYAETKSKIENQKHKSKKKREEEEHEDDAVEAFDQEGFFIIPKSVRHRANQCFGGSDPLRFAPTSKRLSVLISYSPLATCNIA